MISGDYGPVTKVENENNVLLSIDMLYFQKKKLNNDPNDLFFSKEPSVLHFNVPKLLKHLHLRKLNLPLPVKSISIGILGYLCAFIFEPYAED
ncbi:MAG TPA: hypothetical protein DCL77_20990 [Prolixibacteraceae bacterium]|nr:hypothetical protein [Prolixibacteraceae bacterium]